MRKEISEIKFGRSRTQNKSTRNELQTLSTGEKIGSDRIGSETGKRIDINVYDERSYEQTMQRLPTGRRDVQRRAEVLRVFM
jgi:hypothetical protein